VQAGEIISRFHLADATTITKTGKSGKQLMQVKATNLQSYSFQCAGGVKTLALPQDATSFELRTARTEKGGAVPFETNRTDSPLQFRQNVGANLRFDIPKGGSYLDREKGGGEGSAKISRV